MRHVVQRPLTNPQIVDAPATSAAPVFVNHHHMTCSFVEARSTPKVHGAAANWRLADPLILLRAFDYRIVVSPIPAACTNRAVQTLPSVPYR